MAQLLKIGLVHLLLFAFADSFAQTNISGRIIATTSQLPVPYANVFVANSTIGTTTDSTGYFELKNIYSSHFELIVSHVQYNSKTTPFKNVTASITGLGITLEENVTNLEEVSVVSKEDKKWKRLYKQFEREFLGNSVNAAQCKITNPWVVDITKTAGGFTASASEFIIIKNNSLGYEMKFLLEKFIKDGGTVTYAGKPLFKELSDKKLQPQWEKNRLETYLGSKRHFFLALINNTLEQDGYKIYYANLNPQARLFEETKVALRDDIFNNGNLQFDKFLKVVYTKEKANPTYIHDHTSITSVTLPERNGGSSTVTNTISEGPFQISYLFSRLAVVKILEDGRAERPQYLLDYGYWGWERVAELMPFDFKAPLLEHPENTNVTQQPTQVVPIKNGFTLSNLKLPIEEIKQGGPPRDGIPSIDKPLFTETAQSKLAEGEAVLGIVFNGVAKAYPIKIMNWHEVVNDYFAAHPVVITYCPLCGSGIAFDALIDDQPTAFGVSGLLFNSDVLLYDRVTESLWSQLEMQGVAGQHSGKPLTPIITSYSTWGTWKEEHPSTLVLSENTGFTRNYNTSPYTTYLETDDLMFPVSAENKVLKRKEVIFGLSLNGKHKAYPVAKLKRLKGAIEDIVGDEKITVSYNKSGKSVSILDQKGNPLQVTRLYWFAWYAFHPDTAVY
jgi:hypothetical protein